MTPEQIAHEIAAAWIMGPIRMDDLQERIAAALRAYGDAQAAAQAAAQRERDMLIAHDRATQWDAIKAAHPDDAATLAIANARYLEARYLEACDIAALIRAQP